MKLLIDSADIKQIKELNNYYSIDGVTTNPTILTKETGHYFDVIKQIRTIIGEDKMLHVQTIGETADEIVKEAQLLTETLGSNIFIKVPVIKEGYKALKELNNMGINTLATAVFTAQQALMAAKCGADFVAPYVNRIDNVAGNGVNVVAEIVKMYDMYKLKTEVLAASFKNLNQVHGCSLVGAHAITAAPDIIEELHSHPSTDSSVAQFTADWEKGFGTKGIM